MKSLDQDLKIRIFSQLVKTITAKIKATSRAAKSSNRDAIQSEGRMQSRYSTFKEEAQYLEAGMKTKLREYSSGLEKLLEFEKKGGLKEAAERTIRIGSLVKIGKDQLENSKRKAAKNKAQVLFIVPYGGGERIRMRGGIVMTITADTPMGKALLGLQPGDFTEVKMGKEQILVSVDEVV